MLWLLFLVAIVAGEHIANPFLDTPEQWELALGAKYLSMAVILQLLLAEIKQRPLLFRSIVALFCIATWVDFIGHALWQVWSFDSSVPVLVGFSVWLIYEIKRNYSAQSDPIIDHHVYILIHRPTSTWGVIKSLVGFPADSISIYADGQAWSFKRKSGTFSLYSAGPLLLSKNIAVDTGQLLTPELEEMLDDLVGQSRFPGTKCVYAIRHVLRKLGGEFSPRFFDYIPGIYAMRIFRTKNV